MATAQRNSDRPKVHFNADSWEEENPYEPFNLTLGGKVYTWTDPRHLDYRDIAEVQSIEAGTADRRVMEHVVELLVGQDKASGFLANRIPNNKFMAMVTAWRVHYGVSDPGEAAASSS